MSTAREKVIAARADLVLDHPFFGALALRLKLVEDPTSPTAWTDGQSIGYGPAFVDGLTRDELLGVIAHEVLHCANGHPWRRDHREPRRWNVACDYAINYILEESKFTLPDFRLRAEEFDGKSSEWIYDRVSKQDADACGGRNGERPGGGGLDVRDAPTSTSGGGANSAVATEAEWQEAVQQAAAVAKARGEFPAHLERFAKEASQPRVDWKSVLRRFVQQAASQDYVWNRPNRRYLARGFYMPSLYSETMGPIAIAVDTSGSIDQVTIDQFAAEVNSIVNEMRPSSTRVLYADAKVHRIDEFFRDDVVTLKPVGGGGTSHVPVMNAIDEMDEQPVCLICLTDLATMHRPEPPGMPVLWATTNLAEVPYGEVVSIS